MIEALIYEKSLNNKVRCHTCQRRCTINDGEWGHCHTRQNRNGTLFSFVYGQVSVYRKASVEIKPVYHFLPGSFALSLGTVGCNFLCPGCQNWDISFAGVEEPATSTNYFSPEEVINLANINNCSIISWTYNEPTLWFEYTLDIAKLARKTGLYTNYVTNGFMTPEALDLIGPYLDIFRVDIKAFDDNGYKKIAHIKNWRGILDVVKRAQNKWGMHIEIVTNIIPGYNANLDHCRNLAQWIKAELGENTPWHITRFTPKWQLEDVIQTPINGLNKIWEIGKNEGLNHVYIGNVAEHPANHTYCPSCNKAVIKRANFSILENLMLSNECPHCGEEIAGTFILC